MESIVCGYSGRWWSGSGDLGLIRWGSGMARIDRCGSRDRMVGCGLRLGEYTVVEDILLGSGDSCRSRRARVESIGVDVVRQVKRCIGVLCTTSRDGGGHMVPIDTILLLVQHDASATGGTTDEVSAYGGDEEFARHLRGGGRARQIR
jgi:hypothetical protein